MSLRLVYVAYGSLVHACRAGAVLTDTVLCARSATVRPARLVVSVVELYLDLVCSSTVYRVVRASLSAYNF